jgi:hypothetical protein
MKPSRISFPTGWSLALLIVFTLLVNVTAQAQAQSRNVKALVGGTLIDGFGSKPIRNSVIIIEGERIKAVGQVARAPDD